MHEAARAYLRRALQNEILIPERQHSACRLAVLFPVHNEPLRRVFELLESLADQDDISLNTFEVICLVNNDVDDGDPDHAYVRRRNELVLRLPVWQNQPSSNEHLFDSETRNRAHALKKAIRAYVVDKSTPGKDLIGCTVGRARNRLLAEAAHRFHRHGEDGLILMTDADAQLPRRDYLRTAVDLFDNEPFFVGGAGAVQLVFDPDTQNAPERRAVRDRFDRHLLERRWDCLSRFILGKPVDMAPADACFGANILFRANAGAASGGFRPLARFEDAYFFQDLKRHAEAGGFTTAPLPNLPVQAALRNSHRTGASFGYALQKLNEQRPVMVRDPFTGRASELSGKLFHDTVSKMAMRAEGRAFLRRLEHLPQVLYKNAFVT
jgi:hypothetical protein